MKEYTVLAFISVFVTVCVDANAKTHLLKNKLFYFFLGVIFLFTLLVNGYLAGRRVVLYNEMSILGLRIGSIPLEDFLFGFSMVVLTIVLWEYFKRKDL